jgi:uncharacterized membrane protein
MKNFRYFPLGFLLVGMLFMALALNTDNKVYSWVAIGLVTLTMIFGARRHKRRGG